MLRLEAQVALLQVGIVRFDVGRVGNDQIEIRRFGRGQGGEPGAAGEAHGGAVGGGVLRGQREGGGADVGGGHVRVGAFAGEGYGDCAAAGAQVPYAAACAQAGKGGFDEVFGFGAGDEDGGGDGEAAAVEFALAQYVGGGFAGEAAVFEGGQGGGGVGRQGLAAAGDELGGCPAGGGAGKQAGFVFGQEGVAQVVFEGHGV